jgi:Mn2+/Fe2+ NRAMP family transporter
MEWSHHGRCIPDGNFCNRTGIPHPDKPVTQDLLSSFGFVILISILLDIGAQLNIWRIIVVSSTRAQDLANKILPGLGYFLATLIAFGGLVFNVGNISGCGLGLNVLTGITPETGAIISCIIAIGVFWYK